MSIYADSIHSLNVNAGFQFPIMFSDLGGREK